MTDFVFAALLQFSQYFVLTINYRAIAHKKYWFAMCTDAAAVGFAYFIVKQIALAEGYVVLSGMMLGGAMAAVVGIWVTSNWGRE